MYDAQAHKDCPEPYNTLHLNTEDAMKKVVSSAGKTLVLLSGGGMIRDEELLDKVRIAMSAGATGLTFGRNMW